MAYPDLEIEELKSENNISQIYSSGLQYSMVDSDNKMIIPWVYCKDFLNDVIWSSINNKIASIYGVTINPETNKTPLDSIRLITRYPSMKRQDLTSWMESSLLLINEYFKMIGITSQSKIIGRAKVGGKTAIIIEVPREFFLSPPAFSLFTLLIRAGREYVNKGNGSPMDYFDLIDKEGKTWDKFSKNDDSFIRSIMPLLKVMKRDGIYTYLGSDLNESWPDNYSTSFVHNNTGIQAYCTGARIGETYIDYIRRFLPKPVPA